MMAVPMDNASELSSRERVQRLYDKNAELGHQRRRSAQGRMPFDPNSWQQRRENFEVIILEDHAFSEQHELEYQLWQLHYKRIEELRGRFNAAVSSAGSTGVQNEKGGPARSDQVAKIRSQLKTFLSEATGFYHELMLKIKAKYGLPIGYFSSDPESQTSFTEDGNKYNELKKGLTSCHRCLIYLGDLARYKGLYGEGESKIRDFAAASSYYMQASSLWPSSGNPHHQLAILASYSGDELMAVYRYFRSLAVEIPFSTARENLVIAFEKNRQNYTQLLGDCKAALAKTVSGRISGKGRGRGEGRNQQKEIKTVKERTDAPDTQKAFNVKFVRLNGVLFTRTSLETFATVLSSAKGDFLELLSSSSEEDCKFGSDAAASRLFIVRVVAILIFTVHNVNRDSESQSFAEIKRSVLLENAYTAAFQFMGHILLRCSQVQDPLSSYLLPGILVFVEWLACHPNVASSNEAEGEQANARLFFWNHCVCLLNKLSSSGFIHGDEDETCFFSMSIYKEGESANRLALWEDFELRGFSPLHLAQQILDFARKNSPVNDVGNMEKQARVRRIIAAGKTFANTVRVGEKGIYFDARLKKFTMGTEPPLPVGEFDLSNSLQAMRVDDMAQDIPLVKNTESGKRQSVLQLNNDGEDEEEEIVFKPPVVDRKSDVGVPLLTSAEVLGPVHNMSGVDLGASVVSVPASNNGPDMHNGFSTGLRAPISLPGSGVGHVHSALLPASNWLAEGSSVMNDFNNIRLRENGYSMNLKPQEFSGIFQPAALPHPFPQPMTLSAVSLPTAQIPEVGLLSNHHSGLGSTSLESLPALHSAPKKNPVGRPARHIGPPPGFTPARKYAEEPLCGLTMKDGNPLMDDYSWLDGYHMPSSTQGIGMNSAANLSDYAYNHVSRGGSMLGISGFPFPGKQASPFHVPVENHKIWQDCQFPYQENQQKLMKKGRQQPMLLPQQRQGKSLWESQFLV